MEATVAIFQNYWAYQLYAAESVRLITEASALLTERGAQRLKWCRVINTKGKPGRTFLVTLQWNTGIMHSSSTWLLVGNVHVLMVY